MLSGKRVLVTGGTGSLGKILVKRLLDGADGSPSKVTVFSRDEAKQHLMRLEASDERLEFRIGDVRDFPSISDAVRNSDIVVNAAALKQVPSCEYFVEEAVKTNILGPANIVRAISEGARVETVVGVSTDKACKPVNVMGMTKALQERMFLSAGLRCPDTKFVCVRYGNVLASRGSVIPLFLEQVRKGGPVTITSAEMTRFLLPIDQAVDIIIAASADGQTGETYVPLISSAKVIDIARAIIGDGKTMIKNVGTRPGEKIHEILVSEEECHRTVMRSYLGVPYYAIRSGLPELGRIDEKIDAALSSEYSSSNVLLSPDGVVKFLGRYNLIVPVNEQETLK